MTDISALEAYAGQLSEAAAKANASSEKQHQYVHGDDETDVLTEAGWVPSLAKQARLAMEIVLSRGAVTIASVMELATAPRSAAVTTIMRCYHPGINNGGGGRVHYDPAMPRSAHNGGTIFSPTVPWNGAKATLANYLLGVGETSPGGLGCFVRRVADYYTLPMFGGVADWAGGTGFDNRPSIEAAIKSVYHTVIPVGDYGVALAGSIFIQGYVGKRVSGGGTLHKMGPKGTFSFANCIDVKVSGIVMDGQIVKDEADNGNIWSGTRSAVNFVFAVSFTDCHDCAVIATTVYDFAWDGLRAIGTVAAGGATATQSRNIDFIDNTIRGVRGTQIWIKAVSGGKITGNRQRNEETFAQKGNAVFVVEWCEDIEVASNRQYYIGDNGVGVGEMDNNVLAARNKRINVHDNLIRLTRYHAILVAQAEDSAVHRNIVHRSGAKSEMVGTSGVVQCGSITVLGGGFAPPNIGIKVSDNVLINSYEHGIYGFDRPGTALVNASSGIEFLNNTIRGSGRLPTATRLSSSGITSQFQKPATIQGNNIDDVLGDGIRVFGDAKLQNNTMSNITGVGLNVPLDTLLGNTGLSSAISGNSVTDATGSGIVVTSKERLVLSGNTTLRCGRGGAAPGTESTTTALTYSGIALRSIKRVSSTANEMRECGACGLITQFCDSVKDSGSIFSGNGQVFTVNNYKSGAYLEGASLAAPSVVATFITPEGDGGTTQYYPIRIVFGLPGSVSLDSAFVNHSSASLGITEKALINI